MNIRKDALDVEQFHDEFSRIRSKISELEEKKDVINDKLNWYNDEIRTVIHDSIIKEFTGKSFMIDLEVFRQYINFYFRLGFDKDIPEYRKYKSFKLVAGLSLPYYNDDILAKINEVIGDMVSIMESIVHDKVIIYINDTKKDLTPIVNIYFNLEESDDD